MRKKCTVGKKIGRDTPVEMSRYRFVPTKTKFLRSQRWFVEFIDALFKNIGIVVDPLHFDVWAVFSSSMPVDSTLVGVVSLAVLLFSVETLPPLLILLLLGPTIPEKSTLGDGTMFMVLGHFFAGMACSCLMKELSSVCLPFCECPYIEVSLQS